MKSADNKLFVYEKNQIIETICQLRFPPILTIEAKEPADFQEVIRETFPRYECRAEKLPAGSSGEAQTMKNHNFISTDGTCKLSLTKNFIALSTVRYAGWESFANLLDEPLGQFIRIYKPAFFERIGLRFLNGFSREKLGLTGRRWNDLLQPQYLSVLDDDDIEENSVAKCSVDVERKLDAGCGIKIHAGPGSIRRTVRTGSGVQTIQEPEPRFILDLDVFSSTGNIQLQDAAKTLEQLHGYADQIFSDAITDTLHEAMEPVEL